MVSKGVRFRSAPLFLFNAFDYHFRYLSNDKTINEFVMRLNYISPQVNEDFQLLHYRCVNLNQISSNKVVLWLAREFF